MSALFLTLKRYADNFYRRKEEIRKYGTKSNQQSLPRDRENDKYDDPNYSQYS